MLSFNVEIFAGIVIAIFTALLTYFIKSVMDRNILTTAISARIGQHEKEYHKQETWEIAKQAVKDHINSCSALGDISEMKERVKGLEDSTLAIKMAIAYLVKINSGNPAEFGL